MAQRRMFSLKIVDTDAFLDMSPTAQLLYFHLAMRADDDGFVSNPKKIMRMASINDDDLRVLIIKKFIIPFESGVCVIKHWKIHNYIQKDRYTETTYIKEKAQLLDKTNGGYKLDTKCVQNVSTGKVRVGKVRVGKSKSERFKKPSLKEVTDLFKEKGYEYLAENFYNYYESNGWKIGRNPMKSWTATVAQWVSREKPTKKKTELSNKYNKYGNT